MSVQDITVDADSEARARDVRLIMNVKDAMPVIAVKQWKHRLVLAALAIVVVTGLDVTGGLQRAEWISFDWRSQLLRASVAAPDDVAVILIDEASLGAMNPVVGRWPWPRSVHADIVDFLALGRPRAILFDILFTENDRAAGRGGDALSAQDRRLIDATADAGNVIHAMQVFLDLADDANNAMLDRPLPPGVPGSIAAPPASIAAAARRRNNNFYLPFDGLYQASSALGVVNTDSDRDGVYRRVKLLHRYQNALVPSLGVAALAPAAGDGPPYRFGAAAMPTDRDGAYLIHPYGRITTWSASGILASAQQLRDGDAAGLLVDPAEFSGKIVFIGASAAGLEDLKTTPMGSNIPGVFLHASVAANAIGGDMLRLFPDGSQMILAAVLAAATVVGVLTLKGLGGQLAAVALLGAGYIGACLYAFAHQWLMPMATPLTAVIAGAALSFLFLVFTEGRDKRRVRNMLAQYVSPAMLTTVMERYEDHLHAEVGSEECLSILFSDIRGFTNLSETLPARTVVEILNHYFSNMTEIIFRHDGTIDKFIGDAIMAFWGAPVADDAHADKALRAAIDMHRRVRDVNAWIRARGYPEIAIGIGIHSGSVILGNIGSERKLDYTIIGDNVNLASRLEGLTKQYGVPLLVSEDLRKRLTQPVPCYVLDMVRVKGKQEPICIYAPVLGHEPAAAEELAQISQLAFAHYLHREWDQAIALYARLPLETVRDVFTQRCEAFRKTPPPPDWDGVHTLTSK